MKDKPDDFDKMIKRGDVVLFYLCITAVIILLPAVWKSSGETVEIHWWYILMGLIILIGIFSIASIRRLNNNNNYLEEKLKEAEKEQNRLTHEIFYMKKRIEYLKEQQKKLKE